GDVYWGVQKIESNAYDDQSTAVRQFALDSLKNLLALNNLRFEKHSIGYPILFNGERQTDVAVSFAHHDRYVSYSFQIPK
ncbi:MAG: 4-phosphopantetheinyl transferase superfamily protein, partial [Mucilaginibacter sp.]|nr:4-phosphopantetheinyl transferase superfamily protein [Mucilaginibacter sp.]